MKSEHATKVTCKSNYLPPLFTFGYAYSHILFKKNPKYINLTKCRKKIMCLKWFIKNTKYLSWSKPSLLRNIWLQWSEPLGKTKSKLNSYSWLMIRDFPSPTVFLCQTTNPSSNSFAHWLLIILSKESQKTQKRKEKGSISFGWVPVFFQRKWRLRQYCVWWLTPDIRTKERGGGRVGKPALSYPVCVYRQWRIAHRFANLLSAHSQEY